jgi:hypothetical protein
MLARSTPGLARLLSTRLLIFMSINVAVLSASLLFSLSPCLAVAARQPPATVSSSPVVYKFDCEGTFPAEVVALDGAGTAVAVLGQLRFFNYYQSPNQTLPHMVLTTTASLPNIPYPETYSITAFRDGLLIVSAQATGPLLYYYNSSTTDVRPLHQTQATLSAYVTNGTAGCHGTTPDSRLVLDADGLLLVVRHRCPPSLEDNNAGQYDATLFRVNASQDSLALLAMVPGGAAYATSPAPALRLPWAVLSQAPSGAQPQGSPTKPQAVAVRLDHMDAAAGATPAAKAFAPFATGDTSTLTLGGGGLLLRMLPNDDGDHQDPSLTTLGNSTGQPGAWTEINILEDYSQVVAFAVADTGDDNAFGILMVDPNMPTFFYTLRYLNESKLVLEREVDMSDALGLFTPTGSPFVDRGLVTVSTETCAYAWFQTPTHAPPYPPLPPPPTPAPSPPSPPPSPPSPPVAGVLVYANRINISLYAVDAVTGAAAWQVKINTSGLFLPDSYRNFYLDAAASDGCLFGQIEGHLSSSCGSLAVALVVNQTQIEWASCLNSLGPGRIALLSGSAKGGAVLNYSLLQAEANSIPCNLVHLSQDGKVLYREPNNNSGGFFTVISATETETDVIADENTR